MGYVLKSRWLSWWFVAGVFGGCLVVGVFYLFSPWRAAEVALGVRCLPWSARNLQIREDSWTDYVVRGYVELSPADFERLLKAREYHRQDYEKTSPIDEGPVSKEKQLYGTTHYYWHDKTSYVSLETDAGRSWVYFTYSN